MDKKINWILLSGFMVGPILGSGIILLPPLIFSKIGNTAIYGWIIISILGALFAMIFSKLTLMYPGDGGMTLAIEKKFGQTGKLISSVALIFAVMFGPVAILMTATNYLKYIFDFTVIPIEIIGIVLVGVGFYVLMKDISVVSKFIVGLSSVILIILIISSIKIIVNQPVNIGKVKDIEFMSFGKSLLLLFWAIIGWEIVGNYSNEVKDVDSTIKKATRFSIMVVTTVFLIVAVAIQSLNIPNPSMVDVLSPVFGYYSGLLLVLLTLGLCFCTYITIVGAMGRLVYTLSDVGYLPRVFSKKNEKNSPKNGILFFSISHVIVFLLVYMNYVDIEFIVEFSNGFFILNAILGLVAFNRLSNHKGLKVSAIILIGIFLVLVLFLSKVSYIAFAVLMMIAIYLKYNKIYLKET